MTEDKRLEQPLSAAEIEELRELEAKATPGPWTNSLGTIESSEGWHIASVLGYVGPITKGANAALIAAMRNALPHLLAMLTPPTDAAVREAVEHIGEVLDNVRCHLGICGPGDDGERKADASDNWGILDALDECRTLLSFVRAAQNSRAEPTSEEVREAVERTGKPETVAYLNGAAPDDIADHLISSGYTMSTDESIVGQVLYTFTDPAGNHAFFFIEYENDHTSEVDKLRKENNMLWPYAHAHIKAANAAMNFGQETDVYGDDNPAEFETPEDATALIEQCFKEAAAIRAADGRDAILRILNAKAAQSPRLAVSDLAVRNVLLSGFPKHMQSHAASEYTTLEMAEKLVEHLRTAERVRDENIQRWMKAEKSPRLTGERLKEAYLNGYEDGNEDGRALIGCRGVYHSAPRYDSDAAWVKSDTRAAFPDVFGKEG